MAIVRFIEAKEEERAAHRKMKEAEDDEEEASRKIHLAVMKREILTTVFPFLNN